MQLPSAGPDAGRRSRRPEKISGIGPIYFNVMVTLSILPVNSLVSSVNSGETDV